MPHSLFPSPAMVSHVAQTAPIRICLHQRMPQLRLTVRSACRLPICFAHPCAVRTSAQRGRYRMLMSSALDICIEESRASIVPFMQTGMRASAARRTCCASLAQTWCCPCWLSATGWRANGQAFGMPRCARELATFYRHLLRR